MVDFVPFPLMNSIYCKSERDLGMSQGRILFIDAYDSFTNNIVSLLETELLVQVVQVKIDQVIPDFPSFLRQFVAVVAGPGPGHPANAHDVGLIKDLWTLHDEDLLPVLGICLGFQSLAYAFGGAVQPMQNPRHGIESKVTSRGTSIFQGIESLSPIHYHSLEADLGHYCEITSVCPTPDLWKATEKCPELEPLAWDFSSVKNSNALDDSTKPILMAIRHVSKPFYGVQFHPESICADLKAKAIVKNWWYEVQNWYADKEHLSIQNKTVLLCKEALRPSLAPDTDFLTEPRISASSSMYWSSPCSSPISSYSSASSDISLFSLEQDVGMKGSQCLRLYSQTMPLDHLSVPRICETLHLTRGECVILDSENRQMPEVGRYSIIGIISEDTIQHTYSVGTNKVHVKTTSSTGVKSLSPYGNSIFTYLKSLVEEFHVIDQVPDIPFWGGLMGYITYEACLETIKISSAESQGRPDICFAFVERSLVIDHVQKTVQVQSIKENDQRWVYSISETLAKIQPLREPHSRSKPSAEVR